MKNAKTYKTPRTKFIALIHVAKRDLVLNDVKYRALLVGAVNKDSLRAMSDDELKTVIEKLKKHGFKKSKPKCAGTRKMADTEQAKLIRALWISLYNLGEVRDPSENAMASYVKRMTRIDDLKWLSEPQANIVISGLRDWMKRAGYVRPSKPHRKYFYQLQKNINSAHGETVINSAHVLMAQARIAFKQPEEYNEWIIAQGMGANHPYSYSIDEIYILIEKLGISIREMRDANG